MLKFGTRNAKLGYIWAGIRKRCCDISNHPRMFVKAKFCAQMRIFKSKPKIWAAILKKLLSHLKPHHT